MSKLKNKKPVIEEDPEVNTDIKNILMIGVYLPIIYAQNKYKRLSKRSFIDIIIWFIYF